MKGELGPLAQAVAKYQLEHRLQKEMDNFKIIETNLEKIQAMNKPENQNVSKKLSIFNVIIVSNFKK